MPSRPLRQDVIAQARRVVVKLGTQVLSDDVGQLDLALLRSVARQVVTLRQRGVEVTLVSSGAIGAGCAELGLDRRPTDVAEQQAVAAVGQRRLMDRMHEAFSRHGLNVGQLLLTRGDFDDRSRFLNIRNCLGHLHKLGCVPIINENDTVAVDELRVGDNDMLAALICNALPADALVLLTVVDGLLDESGERIDLVQDIDDAMRHVRADRSKWGTGGIQAKLDAVRLVTGAGEVAVIANGRERDVLTRLFDAEHLGTVFVPRGKRLSSRSRWIGLTKRAAGVVTVDAGAATALAKRGKSLLATGIVDVEGSFKPGDVVLVRDDAGRDIARGLTNYAHDEVAAIMGKRSNQYEKALGRPAFAEVVHRDNLVLAEGG